MKISIALTQQQTETKFLTLQDYVYDWAITIA